MLNLFSRQYLFLSLFTDPQIVPDLPSPFRLAFSSFDVFSSFFAHFCTFWHTHKSFPGLSYTFPTPALESSISSKSSGLFFVLSVFCLLFFCREWYLVTDLNSRYTQCFCNGIALRLSQWKELGHVYLYTHTHTHTHTHKGKHKHTHRETHTLHV